MMNLPQNKISYANAADDEIKASTSLVDRSLRNLKHDNSFAVLDLFGDIGAIADTPEGVFHLETRHLSRSLLRINRKRPLLLSSSAHDDKSAVSIALTNPDMEWDGRKLARDTIHIERTKFLWNGVLYERIGLRNFDVTAHRVEIEISFAADFADLFEVRGMHRRQRGSQRKPSVRNDALQFSYDGLDGISRRTSISFFPAPKAIDEGNALFNIALNSRENASIFIAVNCKNEAENILTFAGAYRRLRRERRHLMRASAKIESSNDIFNEVIERATSDLYMLATPVENGHYPFAGIPWYSTVFGRDGILTAIFTLWFDPNFAKGVLLSLAATQAAKTDPLADAQPGKILHERRFGEMANLKEIPFGLYYGTIDATPLFILLACLYFERTGDRETLEKIWGNIENALRWIDEFGDLDGDGFVEYQRQADGGLRNQGWKDSEDSIFHGNGDLVRGPTALCEVQGYVYAAKSALERVSANLGRSSLAERLKQEADALRRNFEQKFWCERLGTYSVALDGDKRPCEVETSNAGHLLFCGIANLERARSVASNLLNANNFSGWGIRTLGTDQARYNPMSYHNGSVWPHENGLIALGFAHYGMKDAAATLFDSIFDVATHQELRRLPELFCGFMRKKNRGPTSYPVACSPQAWAAAAPFAFLSACLGMRVDAARNILEFDRPQLPSFINGLTLRNVTAGGGSADVHIKYDAGHTEVDVLGKRGNISIEVRN
jgi:glycogen debranching enzyme